MFTALKNDFVCGYKDIENKSYAGSSRKHSPSGQAVDTTNGAGPHNIQIFVMTPDGIVLTCLPGFWHSEDLANELALAERLNEVWIDPNLSREQKNERFSEMQLKHLNEHSIAERRRSQMQHFDVAYEKDKRFRTSDVFNRTLIDPRNADLNNLPSYAIKTCDVIMHQRMSSRPFVPYSEFDVAAFSDYGKPMYDKNEDSIAADGSHIAQKSDAPMIGNDPRAHPIKTQAKRQGRNLLMRAANFGIRAALR